MTTPQLCLCGHTYDEHARTDSTECLRPDCDCNFWQRDPLSDEDADG